MECGLTTVPGQLAGHNAVPPVEPDVIINAHCLPVLREDGDGLLYQDSDTTPPTKGATPPAGDGTISGLLAGINEEGDDGHESLKTLLRSGLRAISQFVAPDDDEILETTTEAIIPMVVCCAIVID